MRAKIDYWLAPGMPSVELFAADYESQRFRPHWHGGFAIGAVTRHAQGFYCEGREWVAGEGDLILVNPGQVHDGYPLDGQGWSTRMAYLPDSLMQSLIAANCNSGESRESRNSGNTRDAEGDAPSHSLRFAKPLAHSPAVREVFMAWHRLSETPCDLGTHALTKELFAALGLLMQSAELPTPAGILECSPAPLAEALRLLAGEDRPSVVQLAQDLNWSRATAFRKIKSQFGIAPKPLLNQLRLVVAKDMLARGADVVNVALDCGFHDQSHFSRQFAAAYGLTPAQFREVQLNGHPKAALPR